MILVMSVHPGIRRAGVSLSRRRSDKLRYIRARVEAGADTEYRLSRSMAA